MHFVTSNFNILYSNKIWEPLKKKYNVVIDEDYNNFYLKLNSTTLLNNYKTFHIFIYLDIYNTDKYIKVLAELEKKIFLKNKIFFLYLVKYNDNNLRNNNYILKKISEFIKKINFKTKNLYIKTYLEKKRNFFNSRNNLYIKFPFDISAVREFNKIITNDLKIANSKPYKLIILDCDNTLWGGVLNEDNKKGIIYGDEGEGIIFKQFQSKLKNLKNEGFLLSLSSKNNEKDVWDVMKERKMILQKNDFLKPKINWNEKYLSIKKIILELSLRPSDVIFIDDNILEIQKVKKFIKDINCLHINEPLNIDKIIESDLRFQKLIILEEDIKKYNQYKIKLKYEKQKEESKNNSSFFIKLKQKIKFYNYDKSNFERALQLFNKTNQFNFTLNRYNNSVLEKLTKNKNYEIKLFDLKDKFGYHGIIGLYVINKKGNAIEIIDFVLSCRVFNRYVEDYIIWYILKEYKNKKITIKYLNTELNNKLIPIFLENKYFELKNKKKKKYIYKVIFNNKLNEIKKIFN
jgi:FkbH-like protein